MLQNAAKPRLSVGVTLIAIGSALAFLDLPDLRHTQAKDGGEAGDRSIALPTSVDEARARSQLLHETMRGALQVMHRDFFDDESPLAIPSASLDDVFAELRKSHQVEIGWLNVETDVLNVDHSPDDPFETQAAEALAGGKTEFEAIEGTKFRYAGAIRLSSQCLKCHVKIRTSTQARTAGLVIRMPIQPPE